VLKTATFKLEVKTLLQGYQAISRETVRSKPNAKKSQSGCHIPAQRETRVVEKIDLERLDSWIRSYVYAVNCTGGTETPTVNCV